MLTLALISSLCLLRSSMSAGEDRRLNPEKFIFDQEVIVTRLESVLAQLAEQNALIDDLKAKFQLSDELVRENDAEVAELRKSIESLNSKTETSAGGARSSILKMDTAQLRNCEEIRSNDPESPSGMYLVDPDGFGAGDPPILVFCDMATGSTLVPHDSEYPIEAVDCLDPGCSARAVNYNATLRQLVALTQISQSCRQFVQFDCFGVPLEHGGVAQSWWIDRNGQSRYHWAGSDSALHTCQCGIDGNCRDPSLRCNCNSLVGRELSDEGYITDKEILPITRVNIGRIAAQSYGRYILGKLECSGHVRFSGVPESCADLWQLGHTLSGFYDVQRANEMVKVFCDFSRLPDVQSVERLAGTKTPVYFYVQRRSSHSGPGSTIPFHIERLKMGRSMDLESGTFTAPRPGIYTFTFSAVKSNGRGMASVSLRRNGATIGTAFSPVTPNFFTMAMSSTLQLKAGDQIQLVLERGVLHDDKNHYTHFTGELLHEQV